MSVSACCYSVFHETTSGAITGADLGLDRQFGVIQDAPIRASEEARIAIGLRQEAEQQPSNSRKGFGPFTR